ncbi:MAG: lipid-A-disaccharide synthase [bacterium]
MSIPSIMMVTGEASGDTHCSRLAYKLKELCPFISLFGMGGTMMRQAGVEIVYDISELSVLGITEVIGKLPLMLRRLRELKVLMDQRKPSALVLIDFPDFNMRLMPHAYKNHIPIIYYIPPKAWAWRKKRAYKLAKYTTVIASIFPFEAEIYKQAGANVHYVGHPLLDFAVADLSKSESYNKFQLSDQHPIIGLMPGSRIKEIKSLLPVMLDSIKIIKTNIPDSQFILPVAYTIPKDIIKDLTEPYPYIKITDNSDVYNMMSIANLIIMASGTATLESTFIGTPMIVIYKVSFLSYIIMKSLVNPNIKSTTLPNIIAGENIVPELLQDKANSNNIAEIAINLLKNPEELEKQKKDLYRVKKQIGEPGAIERTAKLILDQIKY